MRRGAARLLDPPVAVLKGLHSGIVGDSDPVAVCRAFVDWAEARIAYLRGAWR